MLDEERRVTYVRKISRICLAIYLKSITAKHSVHPRPDDGKSELGTRHIPGNALISVSSFAVPLPPPCIHSVKCFVAVVTNDKDDGQVEH